MKSPRRNGKAARAKLLQAVAETPGINQTQLCQLVDSPWGTVTYHVDILLRGGRLQAHKEGRELRLYPPSYQEEDRQWTSMLHGQVCSELMNYLHLHPESCVAEIARAMGISRKVVERHLRVLEEQHIVDSDDEYQRRYRLGFAATRLRKLLPQVDVPEPRPRRVDRDRD